ncbi:MAG TPA: CDP-archaeol synthase [Gammaproteobacteria bacterium]|nr:CDP-archaeol synthase [Gammaproteobacteria bacterium]
MRLWLLGELVLLLVIANATPVIISMLLGDRWDQPLDRGLRLADGQPLLGAHKTVRGLFGAIIACTLLAPLVDLSLLQGAGFGALAMSGDLLSSFCKRRLGLRSGHPVPLLDQLPETLLPLWILQPVLGAGPLEIAIAITVFSGVDLLFTRLLVSFQARCS